MTGWAVQRILPDGSIDTPSSGYSPVVSGLKLDGVTDDGPAIQKALDNVEDGNRGAYMLIHGTAGKTCYINSTIQLATSNTILDSDVPFSWGPLAKVQIFGEVVEIPPAIKPKLTADAAAGATVIHLDNVAYFTAGDYIGLRGNRSATGKPLQIFNSYLSAVDATALTITLVTPLDETYLKTNPTTWSNKYSQVTKVISTPLTGTPTRGDIIVHVGSSDAFEVGDIVQIIDDVHTLDDGLVVQVGNFSHKEQAHIVDIPSSTTIQVSHTLFHDYDPASNGRVAKLRTVNNSEIRNWNVTFTETPADTANAFEVRYAYRTGFDRCVLNGIPGASWKTQAFRITDSLACYVKRWAANGADDLTPGRGYGATFYGATLSEISDGYASGCRHSVLAFNGAAGNVAYGNISVNARISDFDFHGADCVDNLIYGNTATGGDQHTADSSIRTAFKIGNPSHVRPGDSVNVIEGNLVTNYRGVAFEIIPEAHGNIFKGNTVRNAEIGIKAGPLTDSTTLQVGATFSGNDFYDVATPLQVDGGTDKAVTKLIIDGNTWTRCGTFVLANAPKARFVRNRVVDPITSTDFVLTASGCTGLQVKGNDFSDWPGKGIKATSCPNARITHNDLHDLGNAQVWYDNLGNAGFLFRDNDTIGFTPTAGAGGTPSVGTLELIPPTGGGGGGGTYPPAGGVPYADLDSTLQATVSAAYLLPGGGIPKTDMASSVQTSLGKADTAYQKPGGGIPNSDLATPGGGTDTSWDSAAEHAYNEWAYDVLEASSSTAATAGRVELTRIRVRTSGTRTRIIYSVASAASGLTGAWAAVFDASGTQLAVTADVSSTVSSTGVKSMATAASFTVTAGQDVYVAVLQTGTTPATLHRAVTSGGLANAGLNAGAGYRFMSGPTGQTSMPGSITPSSGTSSGNTFWCALS